MILPDFLQGQKRGFRHMGVGKGCYAVFRTPGRLISFHRHFLPGVGKARALTVCRQIPGGTGPAVFFRKCDGLNRLPGCPKQHRDRDRPDAVLIVPVLPGLADRQVHGLRHMGVRHRGVVFFHQGFPCVAGDFRLCKGVDNFPACAVYRQVCYLTLPLVGCIQGLFRQGFPVRIQRDGNGLRPQAVLVVPVLPDLLQGQGLFLGHVGVGKFRHPVLRFRGHGVARHRRLVPAVGNLPAVSVHGQIRGGIGPVIFLRQGLAHHGPVACQKGHVHMVRTDAVPVAVIVPDFPDRQVHGGRRMGVGKYGGSAVFCFHRGVAVHRRFTPGIADLLPCLPYWQAGGGIGPLVCAV